MATQSLGWNRPIEWTNVRKVLEEFGQEFVRLYREKLATNGVNTSEASLSNSVRYEVQSGDDGRWIAVDISLLGYWRYVEYGRKAGKWPPLSAIERWIRIKPIVPRAYGGRRVPTTKSLAFLIARKIGTEGIEPRPMFGTTLNNLLRSFDKALSKAVAQDVDRHIDIIIKEY